MKKIPCLFQRVFNGRGNTTLLRDVTIGCEWVLDGEGIASRKWDGTACMVKDSILYKRYDAKRGKSAPVGAIPCDEPDPITGHHPHWIVVDPGKPEDRWHVAAWNAWISYLRGLNTAPANGTYELCGPHFNGNPEAFAGDAFKRHGDVILHPERTFDGIREYLSAFTIEGIVFAHPDGRMCKIRRNDYGLPWGTKGNKQ